MKRTKKILFTAVLSCLLFCTATFAVACAKKKPPAPPVTYAVTYALGSCDGTAYAGTSSLPTESDKAAGATFGLAAAPVWDGYTFLGWSDGAQVYNAGATYTMPGSTVTLTATWQKIATYAVTYALGNCEGTAYAGTSSLPTESDKAANATFDLADEPVWDGYIFKGWSDGTQVYNAGVPYTMPDGVVTLTAQWEKIVTYAVTYAFGNFEGEAYAGSSSLPTESDKAENATFTLADALVWSGRVFLGWSDGTQVHDAGILFTMPAHAVTLTAQWEEEIPAGYVKEKNLSVWTWNNNSVTPVGYTLGLGETVTFRDTFTNRTTTDGGNGPVAQVFANNEIGNGNTFYIFNAYNARKVTNGNWDWWDWNTIMWERSEWDAYGDGVMDSTLGSLTSGSVVITVTLNTSGTLIEAYTMFNASGEKLYTCTYTVNDQAMDSALVRFAADKCTASPATVIYPRNIQVVFEYGYDDTSDSYYKLVGSEYTFGTNPTRTGYVFVGWQAGGTGAYYMRGDTYTLGNENVTFVAAWMQGVTINPVDKNGGKGTVTAYNLAVYNRETGKFDVSFPTFLDGTSGFRKDGYAFKCWEVTVNDSVITVTGDTFSVEPGATITFKAIWGDLLTLSYSLGSCEGTPYGGSTKTPSSVNRAEGGTVKLTLAPKEWAGYTFLGWSDDGGVTLYDPEYKYVMPDHSVTITAIWEKLPRYSVTYLPGSCEGVPYAGQNLIDEREDMYEGAVFPLARAITWDGYIFKGWSDGTNTYNALYRFTMPDHAVTFTAVWEKIPLRSVTYLPGTSDDVQNMPTATTYYEGQIVMTLPVRFGYTFKGWSDGTNTYQAGSKLTLTEDNLTLTAQWEAVDTENEAAIVLSGLWSYEDDDGTVYFHISGMEAAWDAYKVSGSYKVGAFEITGVTDTQITFTIHANRPTGSGTNNIGCTYDIATDTIYTLTYGTYTRVTTPPPTTDNTAAPEESSAPAASANPLLAEPNKRKNEQ